MHSLGTPEDLTAFIEYMLPRRRYGRAGAEAG